eukprot:365670-Chlamydomonas_euryale.AAC.3
MQPRPAAASTAAYTTAAIPVRVLHDGAWHWVVWVERQRGGSRWYGLKGREAAVGGLGRKAERRQSVIRIKRQRGGSRWFGQRGGCWWFGEKGRGRAVGGLGGKAERRQLVVRLERQRGGSWWQARWLWFSLGPL